MTRFLPLLYIFIVLSVSASGILTAQQFSVKGVVLDAETRERLSGTVIRVETRQTGAVANAQGEFTLRSLPAGIYTLLISNLGYETRKITVTLPLRDTSGLEILLKSQMLKTNDVIVSAAKRVQAAQDVPISISSVGQREIQQRGITRLDDALRYVPGVNINRDQVNIRGSSGFSLGLGSRVGVLIDGMPLLAGDGGDAKFDALPMFNVERVEVVKGAGSALYGTGALGGVVNVITASPSETPDFRLRTFAGVFTKPRFSEWQWRNTLPFLGGIDLGYSQRFGDVGVLLAGGFKRSEGHQDYYANHQANGLSKLSFALGQHSTLGLLLNYAVEERSNWVYWKSLRYATLPPDSVNRQERFLSFKTATALDFRTILSDNFFLTARAGVFATRFRTEAPSNTLNSNVTSAANSWNGEIQCTSILDSTLLITFGLTGMLNAIVDSPIIEPALQSATQFIGAGYAQVEYKPLPGWIITTGARLDLEKTSTITNTGIVVNPKLGISYNNSDDTQIRASIGAGFRAPTIAERFAALRYGPFTVLPNNTLRNERSWSFEIGGKQQFSLLGEDWSIDGALFWSMYDDLVEPRLPTASNPQIQFQNITHARIQGAEIALNGWLPGKFLGLESSLTLMNPRDLNLEQVLKYRTPVLWYSRAILPVGAFQLQLDYRYQARVEEIDDLTAVINDAAARVPIHIVDIRLLANFYALTGIPVACTLNVRNLFDYYYNEIIANLAPTRQVVLQFDVKF